jgi:hypothetical protein
MPTAVLKADAVLDANCCPKSSQKILDTKIMCCSVQQPYNHQHVLQSAAALQPPATETYPSHVLSSVNHLPHVYISPYLMCERQGH